MRRFGRVAIVVGFVVLVVLLAADAFGQSGVDIPLEQIHRGDPGDRFLEAEIGASNELGWTCGATLERRNNESIHEGTSLVIVSGANSVTFTNIESVSFDEATKSFVVDGDILVYTQLGEDGVSSMGFLLEFECNPPEEPSPTTTTTTTTIPPGPPSTTTTTEPPPVNGIDTGGGALQHLVAGDPGGSLSPLATWLGIGAASFIVAAFAWAFIAGWKATTDEQ